MTGIEELTTDDGKTLYYSGKDKHFESVGFLVRKYLTGSVINYYTTYSRIISIRIKAKSIYTTIIQVYIPTINYSDNDIEDFNDNIEK